MHSPDLFGFVPVTLSELQLWLFTVPRMAHYQRGRAAYLRNYQVVEKIQRAKVDGSFENIIGDGRCQFCGNDLVPEKTDFPAPISPVDEVVILQRRVAILEVVIRAQAAAAALPALPAALRVRLVK